MLDFVSNIWRCTLILRYCGQIFRNGLLLIDEFTLLILFTIYSWSQPQIYQTHLEPLLKVQSSKG